jgi:hypothetical protein
MERPDGSRWPFPGTHLLPFIDAKYEETGNNWQDRSTVHLIASTSALYSSNIGQNITAASHYGGFTRSP